MTKEEAIEILNNTSFFAPSMERVDEAIDMAISALSIPIMEYPQVDGITPHLIDEPSDKGGDAEMSPQTIHMQQIPSEDGSDLISRADVKKVLREDWVKKAKMPMEADLFLAFAMEDINNLPSVSAERVGKWKTDEYGIYHCPFCQAINNTVYKSYCPNCGARMENKK